MVAKKSTSIGEEEISWQAQKSAMTREKILDAGINCFITMGYSHVTTAKVANAAGVSRGAMLHHFPSKTELIQAATEHVQKKLVEDFSHRIKAIPTSLKGKKYRRAVLDAYWEYLSSDLCTAYHELCVAGRVDPQLRKVLEKSIAEFDRLSPATSSELFQGWENREDRFFLAMDIARFLMEGMAAGQMVTNRQARVQQLLDYLADRLEEIFKETGPSAIGRHTKKQ